MLSDPPPCGPKYEIVHFHPEKPKKFLYLDISAKDLKIEYTYALSFYKTQNAKYPVHMKNFIYSDRVATRNLGCDLGDAATVERAVSDDDWRVSYRKDEPEKQPLPEDLLQRRLCAQRSAKTAITSRHQTEVEKLLSREKQEAKRKEKAKRERLTFKGSESSSSSGSSSDPS